MCDERMVGWGAEAYIHALPKRNQRPQWAIVRRGYQQEGVKRTCDVRRDLALSICAFFGLEDSFGELAKIEG
jgi:hypothetical protein